MVSAKTKTFIMVFVLLLTLGIVSVGCKHQPDRRLMNTSTLPGHTYKDMDKKVKNQNSNSNIVYLGTESSQSDFAFGPNDVSFEFSALR